MRHLTLCFPYLFKLSNFPKKAAHLFLIQLKKIAELELVTLGPAGTVLSQVSLHRLTHVRKYFLRIGKDGGTSPYEGVRTTSRLSALSTAAVPLRRDGSVPGQGSGAI